MPFVQIKYIADPAMHSVPAVSLSPNQQWMVGTSLDNQIVTYSTKDRFRQNRKKVFKGHTVAGYACQPNFSSDGRYVMSGECDLCVLCDLDWVAGLMPICCVAGRLEVQGSVFRHTRGCYVDPPLC